MGKLLKYLGDYKKESVLAPLFKMLEASFELLVPLVMAAVIDIGIGHRDKGYILRFGLLLIGLGVVGLACSVTAQYFSAKAAVGFAAKLRRELFAHIQGLSFGELDRMGTSTLITRLTSDVNQVQSGVNLVLRLFLRSPFIVFGAMIMAFTIDGRAALIFAAAIPLLSMVVFGIMLITMPLYRKVQAGLDIILGITRENLTGARVVRAFHKERAQNDQFEQGNAELTRRQMFVGRISALMNPVTYVLINGAVLVLIWTGALRVNTGDITQGQVVALVNYMSQILVELIKLANLIITVTKALASARRVEGVFERKPSVVTPSLAPQPAESLISAVSPEEEITGRAEDAPAVAFEKVGLTYPGAGAEALSDIDFTVSRGETIGIIGGTGSGKSSLIHLIPRFYDVTGGSVKVNGRDVRELPLEQLRGRIGIVMQKTVLFKGTIRENLQWGKREASEEELLRALKAAQAIDFVESREGGLDADIAQGGKNLSGGQRQRLAIARALVRRPQILLLDDSSSALDYATDAALRRALREMEGEMTVFIVSQRASSIRHADRILVMDDGRIVGCGSHEELLAGCNVYQEICASQRAEGGRRK